MTITPLFDTQTPGGTMSNAPTKSTAAAAVVPVAIIGTMKDDIPTTGTIATTPGPQQPNLVVQVVTPIAAILIRFVNSYLTILVGLVGVGLTTTVIPATDFEHLVLKCAGLSLAGAGFGFLKDLVTIFGRLESKYPLLTGSI